jgi:hypothetical protein
VEGHVGNCQAHTPHATWRLSRLATGEGARYLHAAPPTIHSAMIPTVWFCTDLDGCSLWLHVRARLAERGHAVACVYHATAIDVQDLKFYFSAGRGNIFLVDASKPAGGCRLITAASKCASDSGGWPAGSASNWRGAATASAGRGNIFLVNASQPADGWTGWCLILAANVPAPVVDGWAAGWKLAVVTQRYRHG